jgi:tRNA(Ile)-lysidine synthase
MPILEREFNPKTVETLARAAEILREENLCLEALAEKLSGIGNFLPVVRLRRAPLALRRRAVRAALLRARGSLRRLNFEHVERVLGLLEGGKEVHLPDWWTARRRGGRIVFARERRRATSRERR